MPRPAARSRKTVRISAAMRASGSARWRPAQPMPSAPATASSPRRRSSGISRRASLSVQSAGRSSGRPATRRCAASRCPTSKPALCATSTPSRAKARKRGRASSMVGAPATMASVMPVSRTTKGLIGRPGSTSVTKLSPSRPPSTLTAPISMMPEAAGPSPVVSRSTATNDTSVRDRARASWTRARQCPSAKRKRGSAPSSVARKRAPNSGSRPCAVKTRSSSSSGVAPAGRSIRYSWRRCLRS